MINNYMRIIFLVIIGVEIEFECKIREASKNNNFLKCSLFSRILFLHFQKIFYWRKQTKVKHSIMILSIWYNVRTVFQFI